MFRNSRKNTVISMIDRKAKFLKSHTISFNSVVANKRIKEIKK
jgi:hypothetical protein